MPCSVCHVLRALSQVYSWFLGAYRVSLFVGLAGYAMFILELLGLGPVIRLVLPPGIALDLVW